MLLATLVVFGTFIVSGAGFLLFGSGAYLCSSVRGTYSNLARVCCPSHSHSHHSHHKHGHRAKVNSATVDDIHSSTSTANTRRTSANDFPKTRITEDDSPSLSAQRTPGGRENRAKSIERDRITVVSSTHSNGDAGKETTQPETQRSFVCLFAFAKGATCFFLVFFRRWVRYSNWRGHRGRKRD